MIGRTRMIAWALAAVTIFAVLVIADLGRWIILMGCEPNSAV